MVGRKMAGRRSFIVGLAALAALMLGAAAYAEEGVVPITTSSPEALAAFTQARDLMDNAHVAEARKLLEDAVAKDPNFVMALCALSQAQTNSDKAKQLLDQAASALDKAKVSDGERMWVQVIQAAWKADQAKQREILEAMVKAYPKDRWAHLQLGGLCASLQQYDQAAAEYKKVTEIAPDFAPAYNLLGLLPMVSGQGYEEGEKALKKYVELMPKEPNALDSLAWLLMKEGKFDEAIETWTKALALDPKFPFSLQGQGMAKVLKGKAADGRKSLEQLLKVAPDDGWRSAAQFTLASSYLLEKKFDKAVAAQKKALALFEKAKDHGAMADVYLVLTLMYLQQGKAKDTKANLAKYLGEVEKSVMTDEAKAKVKAGQSVFGDARLAVLAKDLKTAKQKAADYQAFAEKEQNPMWAQGAHFLNALIAAQEKRWDDGIAELAKANPRSTEAMVLLGDLYLAKGDKDQARQQWTKAVNFNELDLEFALMRPVAQQKLSKLK